MKNLLIVAITLCTSLSALAHVIEGTLVLKGSLKTNVYVNGVKSTCKVKIDEVKNLLGVYYMPTDSEEEETEDDSEKDNSPKEDSYGNPAYNIQVQVDLAGRDILNGRRVNFKFKGWMNNLHKVSGNKLMVKDLSYLSENGIRLTIRNDGRLDHVEIPYNGQNVLCKF